MIFVVAFLACVIPSVLFFFWLRSRRKAEPGFSVGCRSALLYGILAEAANDETVAVVTHGGTINQLYHAFLKLPVKDGMFFSTADTGIHEWIVEQTECRVARSNYNAHTKDI